LFLSATTPSRPSSQTKSCVFRGTMFSFLHGTGSLGQLLAPPVAPEERLLQQLTKRQPELALELLQSFVVLPPEERPNLNETTTRDGCLAIHLAALHGYAAVINQLLLLSCDIDAPGPRPSRPTALLLAAQHGHGDIVELLLERGADVSIRDEFGQDAIAIAGTSRLREAIASWIRRRDFLRSVQAAEPERAAAVGHQVAADEVEEQAARSELPKMPPPPPPSPPAAVPSTSAAATPDAASSPPRDLVETPPRREPDLLVASPVMNSVLKAAMDTAEALASPKAVWTRRKDVFDLVSQGKTASQKVVSEKMARLHSKLEADPALASSRAVDLAPKVKDGFTPLHAASESGNLTVVQTLLGLPGVSPWSRDLQGRTALHVAAEKGHQDVCELLEAAMQQCSAHAHLPVGEFAPVDLAGRTPVALSAVNRRTSSRVSLEQHLYAEGDASICPATPLSTRCGGEGVVFGIGETPGWRVFMEDARCAYSPIPGDATGACSLFGVFDGHGGSLVGKYAAQHFLSHFCATAAWGDRDLSAEMLGPALQTAMLSLDSELASLPLLAINETVSKSGKVVLKSEDSSGATALVALVTPDHLLVANAGDCRAIVVGPSSEGGFGNPWEAFRVSIPHKPDSPGELARIEASGSTVNKSEDDPNGPARINGEIATSRALGDFKFKLARDKEGALLPAQQQAISALPDVHVYPRATRDEIVLMACDGVWDVLTDEEVAACLQGELEGTGEPTPEALAAACDVLVRKCLHSRDNVTAIAIRTPGRRAEGDAQRKLWD